MAIPTDAYGGQDYLPALYKIYLGSHNKIMAVALHNDEIVAFEMAQVVDGGRALVRMAGRMRPDLLGRRVNTKIIQFYRREAHVRGWCGTNPKITFTSANEKLTKPWQHKPTTTFFAFRRLVGFEFTKKELERLLANTPASVDVHLLTLSQAEQLLQDERVLSMSADGRWIVHFEPMAAAACNVRSVIREGAASVCASYEGILASAVSISGCDPMSLGMLYSMAFYYHPDYSSTAESILCSHILHHMRIAVQLNFATLHFVCFVTSDIDHQYVQHKAFPGARISSVDLNSRPFYLVEYSLPPSDNQ